MKDYSYMIQVGANTRVSNVRGFPTAGFRSLLQQSQLSNGFLRFSSATLGSTIITQGTRAFPYLGPAQVEVPFGSIIGRILYPLGISFLLPIFTLALVRDKEQKIIVMLRMVCKIINVRMDSGMLLVIISAHTSCFISIIVLLLLCFSPLDME